MESKCLYLENKTRCELYQSNGHDQFNWILLPGGPGADSSYMRSLADACGLPGKVWLMDLPGNGSNTHDNDIDDFSSWEEIFVSSIQHFDNPIIVGHSFGGMFPLLYPELEGILKGFVSIGSSPTLWMKEAVSYGAQFDLPDLTCEMGEFTKDPNQETFDKALDACMPYYFPKDSLEEGRRELLKVPFNFKPAVWWQRRAIELEFNSKWIPETVPMHIITGKYDCICPYTLFDKDLRFKRNNITHTHIESVGHLPWVGAPKKVNDCLQDLVRRIRSEKN